MPSSRAPRTAARLLRLLGPLFLLGLVPCLSAPPASASAEPSLDFVYVDSTVDEAAGGHSALRLGDSVFHYQYYPDGLFLLVNDPWDDFRYLNNDLHNRSMTITRVTVPGPAFETVRSTFYFRYVLQERSLLALDRLIGERDLRRKLAVGDDRLAIEALGLFSATGAVDPHALDLRSLVEAGYGELWLGRSRSAVDDELEKLLALTEPVTGDPSEIPPIPWSVRLHELLELRQALLFLDEARPLADDVLLAADANGGPVSGQERAAFEEFRADVAESILTLLGSSRPDRGRELLVQMARYQALSRTLATGVLATLDPFSDGARRVALDEMPAERRHLDRLVSDAGEAVGAFRRAMADEPDHRSMAYNRLEAAQGRLYELEGSQRHERPARIEEGNLVPCRSGELRIPLPGTAEERREAAQRAEREAERYRRVVAEAFSYNLFTRNCSTELVRLVDGSFSTPELARVSLGGLLQPGEGYSFIPFRLSDTVREVYPESATTHLPSWRLRQLERLYEREGRSTWLRESNTLTSTLYTPSPQDDTVFLFFTDDLIWPRPILGALNLAWAAANAAGGVLMAPADRGEHLVQSLRGMLFSLPELAFFNIRKGSFLPTANTQAAGQGYRRDPEMGGLSTSRQ